MIYEGRIDVHTNHGLYVHQEIAGSNEPCLVADSISSLKTESFNDRDVLPMWKIDSMLQELSANIMAQAKREIDRAAAGKWPLLTFVFTEHDIADDAWQKAGETVSLADYPSLSAAIEFEAGSIPKLNGRPLSQAMTFS